MCMQFSMHYEDKYHIIYLQERFCKNKAENIEYNWDKANGDDTAKI